MSSEWSREWNVIPMLGESEICRHDERRTKAEKKGVKPPRKWIFHFMNSQVTNFSLTRVSLILIAARASLQHPALMLFNWRKKLMFREMKSLNGVNCARIHFYFFSHGSRPSRAEPRFKTISLLYCRRFHLSAMGKSVNGTQDESNCRKKKCSIIAKTVKF